MSQLKSLTKHFHKFFSTPTENLISLISKLRNETSAPIYKCKEALISCNNDYLTAKTLLQSYLQQKGLDSLSNSNASQLKSSKIFLAKFPSSFLIAEIASQSDFVSNTPKFAQMGQEAMELLFSKSNDLALENFNDQSPTEMYEDGKQPVQRENDTEREARLKSINDALLSIFSSYASTFGENIGLLDVALLNYQLNAKNSGVYIHQANSASPNVGSMICIVKFKYDLAGKENERLGKQLAQHILAMNPSKINYCEMQKQFQKHDSTIKDDEGEHDINESVNADSKSALESEECLTKQRFLFDEKITIEQVLAGNTIDFFLIKQPNKQFKLVFQ